MSEWQDIASAPTGGPDGEQAFLVWHEFLGVMVSDGQRCRENRFHRYWMALPDAWIDRRERLPTQGDADRHNCVIIRDRQGHTDMRGWHQVAGSPDIRQWMQPPPPPTAP